MNATVELCRAAFSSAVSAASDQFFSSATSQHNSAQQHTLHWLLAGNDIHLGDMEPTENAYPAFMSFPCKPTEEELNNILSSSENAVVLSGSAATGVLGPTIGKMNIEESADSYRFRVSLPGVAKEQFTCKLTSDGYVFMKGYTITGEKNHLQGWHEI